MGSVIERGDQLLRLELQRCVCQDGAIADAWIFDVVESGRHEALAVALVPRRYGGDEARDAYIVEKARQAIQKAAEKLSVATVFPMDWQWLVLPRLPYSTAGGVDENALRRYLKEAQHVNGDALLAPSAGTNTIDVDSAHQYWDNQLRDAKPPKFPRLNGGGTLRQRMSKDTDEVFDLIAAFRANTHPARVNLAAGVYYTDEGRSWPPDVVSRVERQLHEEADQDRHNYLPIAGDQQFLRAARDLVFFHDNDDAAAAQAVDLDDVNVRVRIASVQTISGTGANHIGARFLVDHLRPRHVWLSDPTWPNHHTIWEYVGLPPRLYPYYNKADCSIDFAGMMQTLETHAQPRDILVLHACAHNPTGLDPSREQWMAIADLCQRKQLFPFFDAAYQGFATGDPVQDAWAIRYFYEQQQLRLEMVVAQSFSKNFGLYGHRTGALHLVLAEVSAELEEKAVANMCHLLLSEFSMAPKYGSTIVKTVLSRKELKAAWMADLKVMSDRMKSMRRALYNELVRIGTPGSWRHIIDQIGMFSYTGLTPVEVDLLREESHIYMLTSGRISISGLNSKNVQYIAKAIYDARTESGQSHGLNVGNGVNSVNGRR